MFFKKITPNYYFAYSDLLFLDYFNLNYFEDVGTYGRLNISTCLHREQFPIKTHIWQVLYHSRGTFRPLLRI